jgi:hypothetical protein
MLWLVKMTRMKVKSELGMSDTTIGDAPKLVVRPLGAEADILTTPVKLIE